MIHSFLRTSRSTYRYSSVVRTDDGTNRHFERIFRSAYAHSIGESRNSKSVIPGKKRTQSRIHSLLFAFYLSSRRKSACLVWLPWTLVWLPWTKHTDIGKRIIISKYFIFLAGIFTSSTRHPHGFHLFFSAIFTRSPFSSLLLLIAIPYRTVFVSANFNVFILTSQTAHHIISQHILSIPSSLDLAFLFFSFLL